jgi:transposase
MAKLYAAIDLHSNNSVLVILDEHDRVVYEKRLPNALPLIVDALAPYRECVQAIAVESTFNWYWLVDGLMDAGYTVKLVNTAAVKVYEGLKYTADEHDARHLAHLLTAGGFADGIHLSEGRAVRARSVTQAITAREVSHGAGTEYSESGEPQLRARDFDRRHSQAR